MIEFVVQAIQIERFIQNIFKNTKNREEKSA
jgi:hypothetical protein